MSLAAGPSQPTGDQERETLKEFLYATIQDPKFQQMTWKIYNTRHKRKYFVIYEFKDGPEGRSRNKTKLQKFGHIMEYVKIFKRIPKPHELSEEDLMKYQLELINKLKQEDWCKFVERSERPNNLAVNKFEIESTTAQNVDGFRSLANPLVYMDTLDLSYSNTNALSAPLHYQLAATSISRSPMHQERQTLLQQLNQQSQSSSTASTLHNSSSLLGNSEIIQQFRQLGLTDSELRKVRVKIAVDDRKVADERADLGEHGLQVYHGDRRRSMEVINRYEPSMYRKLSDIGVNAIEIKEQFVCSKASRDALKHFQVGGLVIRYHPEDCSISLTRYTQVRVYCESHIMTGDKIERTCEASAGWNNVAKVFSFPILRSTRSSDTSIRIKIGSNNVKIEIIPFQIDTSAGHGSTHPSEPTALSSVSENRMPHVQETHWDYQSSYT